MLVIEYKWQVPLSTGLKVIVEETDKLQTHEDKMSFYPDSLDMIYNLLIIRNALSRMEKLLTWWLGWNTL